MDEVRTQLPFKSEIPLGRIIGDTANSNGKVFTAFKPEAERARILSLPQVKLTPKTATDPAEIEAQLTQVATDGVAFDLEEHGPGIYAVAAPVRDQSGDVKATLSVVAPKERFAPQDKKKYAQAVKCVAASFSAYLGYSGGK